MPCVFPILSLKVLSFATGDASEHRRHGLAYLAGVVCSFVLIAGVLISLQSAGRWVGWGFQLQSTAFVIGLAYLFALMGLSLSGLVLFGGRWMNLGAGLATAPGTQGSFFTGVLAVVVASPCTAPFMGTALGYALTQPPLEALAVFASLGVGMAAPMVAISTSTTARRWLPKPGAWMETLKQVMAFPLYLTAVWLLWVAGQAKWGRHDGSRGRRPRDAGAGADIASRWADGANGGYRLCHIGSLAGWRARRRLVFCQSSRP